MKSFQTLFSAAFVALCSAGASAGVISYDLRDDGHFHGSGDQNYYHNVTGGVEMIARGYENGLSDREAVTRTSDGLGVNSDGDDTSQLDGTDGAEWLRFDLSASGILSYIDFTRFGSDDDWNLIVDGVSMFSGNGTDPWSGGIAFSSWFAIGADHSSDEFRIGKIRITMPDPTAVPEPGVALLLGAGLVLAGLRRRRRTS